ncbi:MAG: universal stress protein [Pseudomonadota bacterium]
MRMIFVPVADRPECARALRTAFELGHSVGSHVTGCHIRPHSYSEVKLPKELTSLIDSEAAWKAAVKGKTSKKSSAAAAALFGTIAEKYDYELIKKPRATPIAIWQERVGSPDKVLSIVGPVSDLLVVSRPASKGGQLARLFLTSALMNAVRPVLILPQSGKTGVGKRICIAWNQSPEAMRAVVASMPLLQQAEQVTIVASGAEAGLGPKAAQLATYLRYWGVRTKRVHERRASDDAKALLGAYKDTGSDLLVMGAYSRSRLRQQIFGGVTDYMLNRANIPVFMLHS